MSRTVFEHDQFLGARQASWRTSGFVVSRMAPTVPEDGVVEHAHAEAHFVLVLEGDYISSARDASRTERGPTLIYNPPGTVHRDRYRSETGLFVTVAVALAAQRRLEEVLTLPDYACVPGPAALQAALRLLRADADAGEGESDALGLESLCVELMTTTASHYEKLCEQSPRWLLRARDCLREEATSTLGLGDIAHSCGVHPVYLARAFRAHFGCSPGAYQRRFRLNRAAAMLAADAVDMAEIAQACGYFDQAHFSRAFRQAFGLPPGHYRLQHRQTRVHSGSVRTRRP